MTNLFRILMLAATLTAGASIVTTASADTSSGIRMACESGQITPHGVFDCR